MIYTGHRTFFAEKDSSYTPCIDPELLPSTTLQDAVVKAVIFDALGLNPSQAPHLMNRHLRWSSENEHITSAVLSNSSDGCISVSSTCCFLTRIAVEKLSASDSSGNIEHGFLPRLAPLFNPSLQISTRFHARSKSKPGRSKKRSNYSNVHLLKNQTRLQRPRERHSADEQPPNRLRGLIMYLGSSCMFGIIVFQSRI